MPICVAMFDGLSIVQYQHSHNIYKEQIAYVTMIQKDVPLERYLLFYATGKNKVYRTLTESRRHTQFQEL